MIKTGMTESGFEYAVDESKLDDMEILDALVELEEGEPTALPVISRYIFTPALKKKAYAKIKTENGGKVPVDRFGKLVLEILEDMGKAGKKSEPLQQ